MIKRVDVIGSGVDCLTWDSATSKIRSWADRRESRVVCICNAHSLVTARHDVDFRKVVSSADMVTPDGASVSTLMRLLGEKSQMRINGPDLMLKYCENIAGSDESIYLYGSSERTLELLVAALKARFPGLVIAGAYSPPYRALTLEEDALVVERINLSGAGTVWVSLGCPKQEKWMFDHKDRVRGVMIGVGAAFDYHAGVIKRAPIWMQRNGLEWAHRLFSEPKRLWRRYFSTNSQFIFFALMQLLSRKISK